MRKILIETEIPFGEDKRLIKRLWKVDKSKNFPDGIEFAYQLLGLKEDRWIQLARIDNQMHEGKPGTHIHVLGRDYVKWEKLDFEEAQKRILEIGEKI